MPIEPVLQEKRDEILRIAAKHGARNVRLFGWAARGEAGNDSDIDLLVEFEPGRSLLDHAGPVSDLESILGRKVDVVSEDGLYRLPHCRILRGPPTVTRDPRVCLADILECAEKIDLFTAEGRARFFRDEMVQDTVLRNFEVIGEAAKRLDGAYRAAHFEIPWRALAGLRDVPTHQCVGVAELTPPLDQLERELAGEEAVSSHMTSAGYAIATLRTIQTNLKELGCGR